MTKLTEKEQSFLQQLRQSQYSGRMLYEFWKTDGSKLSVFTILQKLSTIQVCALISDLHTFQSQSPRAEYIKIDNCIRDLKFSCELKRKQEIQREEKQRNQEPIDLRNTEIIQVRPNHSQKFEQQQQQVSKAEAEQQPTTTQQQRINQDSQTDKLKEDKLKEQGESYLCWFIKNFIGLFLSFVTNLIAIGKEFGSSDSKGIWAGVLAISGIGFIVFLIIAIRNGTCGALYQSISDCFQKKQTKQGRGLGDGTVEQISQLMREQENIGQS